ncbi:hypothetical protein RJ640_015829 [Escallonia rubra]|uniref:MD-2-related lipid-recognition domain-containing protein n=1 Tax=Escallonia rubra TaxID=112253 RepID=A0AA88R9Y5_9ASTE|nr:hypothetical protein RJ640_015829 [Escallonia rubra]
MEILAGNRQLSLILLLLATACLVLPSIQATKVKYCDGKGNYNVKVHGVHISPEPVTPGKPATFNISASTGQTVSGGKAALEVSYFGVRVHREDHNLCEETSCPISPGNFVLSHTQTLPAFTPPGSYTLRMKMEDANKHQLTCFSFSFKIGFGSSVSSM